MLFRSVSAEAGAKLVLTYLHDRLEMDMVSGLTLHCAAREGHSHAVGQLLTWGAQVDTLDQHGRTALFLSVSGQHTDTARILLQAGAETNITDCNGVAIQQLARKEDMVHLLQQYLIKSDAF